MVIGSVCSIENTTTITIPVIAFKGKIPTSPDASAFVTKHLFEPLFAIRESSHE
jgi:hypothetical protein